jgi:hypothetical protein
MKHTNTKKGIYYIMESIKQHLDWDDEQLVKKLGEAFKEAHDNGKMHVNVDEFHEHYSELEPNVTLAVLKDQGVQKGIIGIDNKQIRPTPLGIKRCNLDKSFYS